MKKILAAAVALVALAGGTALAGTCGSSHTHSSDGIEATQASAKKAEYSTIVETAVAAGNFNTLVAAVKAAGLADALSSEGPFTVFAPTDEAFAKLPEGTVESLLANPEKLKAILTYHVVEGTVMAGDVVNIDKAETLNGQSFKVKVNDGTVMIDNATVIKTDIKCSNGVIHVIDSVILPEEKK